MSDNQPVFEESNQPIRVGSEVLINYLGGDVDVVRVVSLDYDERWNVWDVTYRHADGRRAQAEACEFSPYEDEDFDPETRQMFASLDLFGARS